MAEVLQLRRGSAGEGAGRNTPGGQRDGARPRQLVRAPEVAELRAFCAATDLGSISRAARLLHLSQPALSKRLRKLEAVAGTELLQRSTRGVSPTAAGTQLYRTARRLLAAADAVEALMCGFSADGVPVRVAASPTMAECWLPELLVTLEAANERHLSVEVVTANSTTARAMVRDGRAEVAVVAVEMGDMPDDGLNATTICEDEIVVAVPPGHRWAAPREIDVEDFASTPVIQRDPGANSSRLVAAGLEAIGLSQAPPLAEIGSTAAARSAALAQNVPVLLSLMALRGERELLVRRVSRLRFERSFALVLAGWIEDLPPAARFLVHHLLAGGGQPTRAVAAAAAAGGR